MQTENTPEEYLTPSYVSLLLKVPEKTLRQWRWRKIGPGYVKLGSAQKSLIRYRAKDIANYLEQSTIMLSR